MAEMTLLQMTQNILSAMDSDEVNSISDTVESLQVANIIQNKYYDILTRGNLPEQNVLFQLTPSNDITAPVLMTLPAGTGNIQWIKYFDSSTRDSQQVSQFGSYSHGVNLDIQSSQNWNTTSNTSNSISLGSKTFVVASSSLPISTGQGVIIFNGPNNMFGQVTSYVGTTLMLTITSYSGSGTFTSWTLSNATSAGVAGYKYVTILPIEQFLDMVNRFNPTDNNVQTLVFTEGGLNFNFYYKTDHQPQYCTVFENKTLIFDSYDLGFDSTLQASKTLVFGQIVSPFSLTDGFIPDMDDNKFPLLLNESKSLAFYELKQMPHQKADQEIKRQWSTVQKDKSVSNKPTYFEQLPSFGRLPRTGGYSSGGYAAYKWMRQTGP